MEYVPVNMAILIVRLTEASLGNASIWVVAAPLLLSMPILHKMKKICAVYLSVLIQIGDRFCW
jgi:hypothetical protein